MGLGVRARGRFLISLLVGLVLLTARGGQWHGWVAIGVTVASLTGFTARIRPVLTAVGDGLDMAEKALQREEALVQQFRAQQTAERVRLEAELERLTAQEQNLTVQLAAAAAAEAQARSEERDLRADRRLRRFLEERSGSSDYQGQLGLISLLHKDFRRLDTLLRLARESADSDLPRIDRIILYIDDLDRCPPARVVEVLQAIHLLLALPLFVVVVGVDPRWLFGSLQRHYHALLQPQAPGQTADDDMSHWASTPQDYLEKIFQIPFALMPMTSRGFAQLISDLAGEPAAQLATSSRRPRRPQLATTSRRPCVIGQQPMVRSQPCPLRQARHPREPTGQKPSRRDSKKLATVGLPTSLRHRLRLRATARHRTRTLPFSRARPTRTSCLPCSRRTRRNSAYSSGKDRWPVRVPMASTRTRSACG